MITALCFLVGLVVLARMSWPKSAHVPRVTVGSILSGAFLRIIAFFVVAGIVLVLLAAMT